MSNQTIVKLGILGPGSFMIPCDFTCEMCKKSSSADGTLLIELTAGVEYDFAIKSICLECGHVSMNPILKGGLEDDRT